MLHLAQHDMAARVSHNMEHVAITHPEWGFIEKIVIYLKNTRRIQPFAIDKRGFGMQAAWLCVESIDDLKRATGH
jgi:hypothetical protein